MQILNGWTLEFVKGAELNGMNLSAGAVAVSVTDFAQDVAWSVEQWTAFGPAFDRTRLAASGPAWQGIASDGLDQQCSHPGAGGGTLRQARCQG